MLSNILNTAINFDTGFNTHKTNVDVRERPKTHTPIVNSYTQYSQYNKYSETVEGYRAKYSETSGGYDYSAGYSYTDYHSEHHNEMTSGGTEYTPSDHYDFGGHNKSWPAHTQKSDGTHNNSNWPHNEVIKVPSHNEYDKYTQSYTETDYDYNHTNYTKTVSTGFDHTNYIPTAPSFYVDPDGTGPTGIKGAEEVTGLMQVRGTIQVGLHSYDKNNDGVGTQDVPSKSVYYSVQYRKQGATSWSQLHPAGALNASSTVSKFAFDTTILENNATYELQAKAHNLIQGSLVQAGPTKMVTIFVKQNDPATVQVDNSSEFINFKFGDKGVLNAANVFKNYPGLYAVNPSAQTEGILVRLTMRDTDPTQYQKGTVKLLTTSGTTISTQNIIWTPSGNNVVRSNGANITGYVFIPKSAYAGREIPAKIRLNIEEYEDAACTLLASNTTMIETISASNTTPLALNLDLVKPTIGVSYNAGTSSYTKTATANITVTDGLSGVDTVLAQWVKLGDTINESNWVTKSALSSMVSPAGVTGEYRLHVRAKDKLQNEENTFGAYIKLDNTTPTITINAATNGNTTYEKSHTTTVNVSDAHSGVATRQYQWTTSAAFPAAGTWVNFTDGAPIQTPAGATGDYYLHIKSTDNAGNYSQLTSNVFKVDNTGLVVTFGTNGNTTYERSQSTTVTVTDAHSGVASRQYQWTNSTATPTTGTWLNFANGVEITKNTQTGDFYLHVKVVDNAGNITDTRSNVFRLDNTVPTGVITGNPVVLTPPPANLKVTVSDGHSGVRRVRLLSLEYNGVPVDASLWNGNWYNGSVYDYPLIYNGEYIFEIEDMSGNINTVSASVTKMNFEVIINDFKIDPNQVKTSIIYNGKNAHVIKRNEFYSTFLATVEDKNVGDELRYNLEITGPKSFSIMNKSISRTGEIESTTDNTWLIDSATMANWPDGMYKARYTVKDSIPSFGELSSKFEELYFFLLREKPPVPIININPATKKADISYPDHPILTVASGLSSTLKKEYAIGDGTYKPYAGPIDLSSYTSDTVIYAKYTDLNDNSSIVLKNYIHVAGPAVTPPGIAIPGEVTVEETMSTTNIFINIRNPKDNGELHDTTFDFLK